MPFVTQMLLDNNTIRPPRTGRKTYRVRHCPSLYLMVTATGHKSWVLMLRPTGGKQLKETLGTVAAVPRLDDAVAHAQALQAKARAGRNPKTERQAAAALAATNTVAAAVARYFDEHVE